MQGIAEHIARERRLVGAKQLRYSLNFARYYHQWYNATLLELLTPDRLLRVLDCGCGTGIFLPALQRRYPRTVGLDFCLENLSAAHAVNGSVPLVVGDIEDLPLAPQSFDQIVCRGVLHRLSEVGRGLQQLFVALKQGGDLVISEPIGDSRALNAFRGAALAAGRHPPGAAYRLPHHRRVDRGGTPRRLPHGALVPPRLPRVSRAGFPGSATSHAPRSRSYDAGEAVSRPRPRAGEDPLRQHLVLAGGLPFPETSRVGLARRALIGQRSLHALSYPDVHPVLFVRKSDSTSADHRHLAGRAHRPAPLV
jgi:SAM-dependent methyltransferase